MKAIKSFFSSLFSKKEPQTQKVEDLGYEQLPEEPSTIYVTPYSQSMKFQTWNEQYAYDKARNILANKNGEFNSQYTNVNPEHILNNIRLSITDRTEFAFNQIRNEYGSTLDLPVIRSIVHLAATDYVQILTNAMWMEERGIKKQTYYNGEL